MRGKPSLLPALVLLARPHKLVLESYREWLWAEGKGSFLIGYSVSLLWFPGNLTPQLSWCWQHEDTLATPGATGGSALGSMSMRWRAWAAVQGKSLFPRDSKLPQHGQEPREKAYMNHIWFHLRQLLRHRNDSMRRCGESSPSLHNLVGGGCADSVNGSHYS